MSRRRLALRIAAGSLVALVAVLTLVGGDVSGFFVGDSRWKDLAVDNRLSLVFLLAIAGLTAAVVVLLRTWAAAAAQDPPDDRVRRRLIMAIFVVAVTAPMLVVNARSMGRLVVYDHPRKDLGAKEELIDLAVWLSDHRLLVMTAGVLLAVVVSAARSAQARP